MRVFRHSAAVACCSAVFVSSFAPQSSFPTTRDLHLEQSTSSRLSLTASSAEETYIVSLPKPLGITIEKVPGANTVAIVAVRGAGRNPVCNVLTRPPPCQHPGRLYHRPYTIHLGPIFEIYRSFFSFFIVFLKHLFFE